MMQRSGVKFSNLCKLFNAQVDILQSKNFGIWAATSSTPWVDSYPWKDNGLPENLQDSVFNVQRDINDGYANIVETYDEDAAEETRVKGKKLSKILARQAQHDLDYLLLDCGELEQRKMLAALNMFYEVAAQDPKSKYHDTSVLNSVFFMAQSIELYLEHGYQAVYGPKHL